MQQGEGRLLLPQQGRPFAPLEDPPAATCITPARAAGRLGRSAEDQGLRSPLMLCDGGRSLALSELGLLQESGVRAPEQLPAAEGDSMRPPGRGDGADRVWRCAGLRLFLGLCHTETRETRVSVEETMARLREVEEELEMMRMENFYWHCHGLNMFF